MSRAKLPQTTNARRFPVEARRLLGRIETLLRDEKRRAFEIGDLVNRLRDEHRLPVKDQAALLGASRQRLSELRRTAQAFASDERDARVDFHFFTIAARSARRLDMKPADVLAEVMRHGLQSTRAATRFLAIKRQATADRQAAAKAARMTAMDGELFNQCHHADFRDVLVKLPDHSIKLILADAPYGQYGRLGDCEYATTSATRRDCDNRGDAVVQTLVNDLLALAGPKMDAGGCLVLFRPGGEFDPGWLTTAIAEHGWVCVQALTWHKGLRKLGSGNEPYATASERVLVLGRSGERWVNHDASDRSDVIEVPPIRPRYVTGHEHHQFEKPVELMRRLIGKHTYRGELVFEPFGGSGAGSAAAIAMSRRWVCCETHRANFDFATARLGRLLAGASADTG